MLDFIPNWLKAKRDRRDRRATVINNIREHAVEDNYSLQGGRPDPDELYDLHDGDQQS